ncbi:hypothetical protein R1flu_022492 [Riccia fluitans]|uniref:Metallothionein n=1 Tax=Riccia fluitans TaxID=41844 RepID=A0ABD1XPE7_9MARC
MSSCGANTECCKSACCGDPCTCGESCQCSAKISGGGASATGGSCTCGENCKCTVCSCSRASEGGDCKCDNTCKCDPCESAVVVRQSLYAYMHVRVNCHKRMDSNCSIIYEFNFSSNVETRSRPGSESAEPEGTVDDVWFSSSIVRSGNESVRRYSSVITFHTVKCVIPV